ncbi:MAG TPA: hypothetical protein VHB48_00245 [Chitinophagaceae bacterium]|nr:hypothetical protein [Chitinophagaceae bacterium]
MNDEALSPEDSLKLIQAMISKAKETFADNSYYFLLWGWLVFAACIGQFVLKAIFNSPYHPVVWCVNIPGIVFSLTRVLKGNKTLVARGYVTAILDYLWAGIVLSFILFGFVCARMGWQNCYMLYMLLYAMGSFVTGRLLRFAPLVWGAAASAALAFITTFTTFNINILLCAAAVALCYIIPGYMLKATYKKQ